MRRGALVLLLTWGALACTSEIAPIRDCEARGDAQPVCGYQNPEDLVLLPSGRHLIVSEYGGMERGDPGFLSRHAVGAEGDGSPTPRTELFRGGDAAGAAPTWGDPACPGPPDDFSPHGIDLVERSDGRFALLVVNHGGRESVELFEVRDPRGDATVAWRGCVVADAEHWWNDVEGRADGGFYVSHMMPRRGGGAAQAWEMLKTAVFGVASGAVLSWSPGSGLVRVEGSEAAFANGIALSADERVLYVNENMGDRVFGLELATGRRLGEAAVATPDNATWADDGRLLVASLTAPVRELLACDELREGACPAAFEIVAVDPESFATERIYRGDGVTMGAGTVGLQVGDDLYIGTFAGDRLLRVRGAASGHGGPP